MSPELPRNYRPQLSIVSPELEGLLHIGLEGRPVHRPVQCHGGDQPGGSQAGDEGGGLPMPPGHGRDQAFATWATAAQSGHVRLRPGFINEDKTFRPQPSLPVAPVMAFAHDVGALLFRRTHGFFYSCNRDREASH